MFSFLIAWIFAALVINICVRFVFKTTPRRMLYDNIFNTDNSSSYLNGYLAGITNVKMYYYIFNTIPSSNWLDANKCHILNDRDKLLQTVDDQTKRGAGIV